jgi:nickel-dependent lactate racemase
VASGRLEDNPIRADIEEGARMLGVHFILNVVLDLGGHVIGAVAGDVIAAHRRGVEMAARRCEIPIGEEADIVVVSAGGYPLDKDLYQAETALDRAQYAVREGGTIILVTECEEGFGHPLLEAWLREAQVPEDTVGRIQQGYVLGGHKAAAIARVLRKANVYLVSALPEPSVQACHLTPFQDLAAALEGALRVMGSAASVTVLPHGGSTLPVLSRSSARSV